MNLEERIRRATENYAQDPKHSLPGFVPIGHTGDAFYAGSKWMISEVQPKLCECCKKKFLDEDDDRE